jgi:hypothetical protein
MWLYGFCLHMRQVQQRKETGHARLLWGRMYCAARSSLGMERAKALTAICAAEKAKLDPSKEFEITLGVLEGGE